MEKIDFPWVKSALERLPPTVSAMPHALLLTGQAGLGKRTTALFLAKALLCETERAGAGGLRKMSVLPSVRCRQSFRSAHSLKSDRRMYRPASHRKKNRQRRRRNRAARFRWTRSVPLSDFVAITAHRGRAKVIVIAPAESMHPSAANALLKMLEEPPGRATYFILVSHRPDRVLPTIRSRCFQVPFGVPSTGCRAGLAGGAGDRTSQAGVGTVEAMLHWQHWRRARTRSSGTSARRCSTN